MLLVTLEESIASAEWLETISLYRPISEPILIVPRLVPTTISSNFPRKDGSYNNDASGKADR